MDNIVSTNTETFTYDGEEITLTITDEFKKAYQMMENGESFFLTGKAGSGKSSILKYFRAKTNKTVVVLAFTGLAAINVNGQTIHSFFNLPIGFIDTDSVKFKAYLMEIMRSVDTIIIDEVSMVRADLMDAINKSLQKHRGNTKHFGGVQMIFIGDLYQLSPIVEKDLGEVYSHYYKTPFFFDAHVFELLRLPLINLEKIHRQKEENLIQILNNVRERKNIKETLKLLNDKVTTDFSLLADNDTVILCTTNNKVVEINRLFLDRIKLSEFKFRAIVDGTFDAKSYPTDEVLVLKEGAKIIFVKNDPGKLYVNGDVGIIRKLDQYFIDVEVKKRHIRLNRDKWEKVKYKMKHGRVSKEVIGTFEQYPIKLAWAITIHKSQGQTYDSVIIDLDSGAFTSGQTYVALSRARTMEGIKLKRPVAESDIILDERILGFKDIFLADY
jgi:hypothetical protein